MTPCRGHAQKPASKNVSTQSSIYLHLNVKETISSGGSRATYSEYPQLITVSRLTEVAALPVLFHRELIVPLKPGVDSESCPSWNSLKEKDKAALPSFFKLVSPQPVPPRGTSMTTSLADKENLFPETEGGAAVKRIKDNSLN